MQILSPAGVAALVSLVFLIITPAPAQILDGIEDSVKRAVENEAKRQVDRAVQEAIRCLVGDRECVEQAREEGRDVVVVDEDGQVGGDDSGGGGPRAERADRGRGVVRRHPTSGAGSRTQVET